LASRDIPWWLEEGELGELCPACLQRYAHQMERRCPECDTASCSLCFYSVARGEMLCLHCSRKSPVRGNE
jgi:hypothetical protein